MFGRSLEVSQGLGPEPVELCVQQMDAVRGASVDPSRADRLVDDKPGGLEDLEVLRYRRSPDGQIESQFAHRPGPLGEPLEDRPRGGCQNGVGGRDDDDARRAERDAQPADVGALALDEGADLVAY